MQCWQCGAGIRPGAKLCVYCGANLATDAPAADAGMQHRPSSGSRAEREGAGGRSRRGDAWDDVAAEDDDRRPYAGGGGQRDRDRGGAYRGRDARDFEPGARDSSRRGGRNERDPLADPRAPQSVRSMPTRDANSSRRGEQERRDWRRDDGRGSSRDERYQSRYEEPKQERRDDRSRSDRSTDDERWDARDRSPRDRYPDRGRGDRQAAYMEDSQEYSAEYSAEYPARSGWHDESAEFEQPGRYGRGDYDERPGRGWQDASRGGSNRAAFVEPMEDSWGMPAAAGWTDESVRIPTSPSRQGAKRGKGSAAKRGDQPAKKRGRAPVFIGVALILALLAGAGLFLRPMILSHLRGASSATCAPSTASATPVASATPQANYKLYTDKQAGYSLPYPTAWSASSGTDTSQAQTDDVTHFAQSSPNAVFTVEHTPQFDCATNTEIITSEVQGGQQAGETFTETPSASGTQTVGGEPCMRKEYAVTTQNKSSLHMAIIGCHHQGKGYGFVIYSDATTYTQVSSGAFQTMLSGFRFTN